LPVLDQAVYLVTVREGSEVYADMALVAILSLRPWRNPRNPGERQSPLPR